MEIQRGDTIDGGKRWLKITLSTIYWEKWTVTIRGCTIWKGFECEYNGVCTPMYTSVKSLKMKLRCRDDTMPKTVDTRSHCKVWLRACNNLLQPPPYISFFGGCGRLLFALNHTLQVAVASCIYSFWHGVIPTS